MTTDVIIPQWNQRERTETCVRSIVKHAPDVRIILIDNGSAEEHRIDAELRPTDLLIRNTENLGFVAATNQGLWAASDADFVVLQNNDTEIYDDIYVRMRRIFAREPHFGALGPITSEKCGSWQAIDNILRLWVQRERGDVGSLRAMLGCSDYAERALSAAIAFGDHVEPVTGMIAFFCTMLTRRALDAVGHLDPDYGVGFGDDDDYCARLHEAGFGVGYVPGAYVRHDHRSTFKLRFTQEEIAQQQHAAIAMFRRKQAERAAKK